MKGNWNFKYALNLLYFIMICVSVYMSLEFGGILLSGSYETSGLYTQLNLIIGLIVTIILGLGALTMLMISFLRYLKNNKKA